MKKYINILFWIIFAAYFIAVFGFINNKQKNALCTSINITYKDTILDKFISKQEILKIIDPENQKVLGKKLDEINVAELEKKISTQHFVKSAEVYKKINGELNVELYQRKPIIRIINKYGKSFYISENGVILPISKNFIPRLPIVTGNINFSPDFDTITNITNYKIINKDIKLLNDIFTLANFIKNNELWNAQIQQIYINNENEFEIIPLVGNQTIIIGNIEDFEEKFIKLETIYKNGFSVENINNYKEINLKYKNQVICVKK
ncbi:MAG: hypothetical protein JXR51_06705 [Bacteroidales bacterium]|nr:hypothetical protein [Bacteroidales bacterium]MBN2756853.1 hypothetical protein [Bacteroidales bacterium]